MKNNKTASSTKSSTRDRAFKATKKAELRKRRPIHKRFLLHPSTVFFLLLTGVILTGWTINGYANTIIVNGRVPAPIPSAAEITSPADQTRFTTTPVTVSGTCPSNTYVKLYRNNIFSGVTACGSSVTTFQIETDLTVGSNELFVKVFNVTDDEGPESGRITVWYDLPSSPAHGNTPIAGSTAPKISDQTGSSSNTTSDFYIKADYSQYEAYDSGQLASLEIGLSGGVGPYAVTVLWGDGRESTIVRDDQSFFTTTHVYNFKGNEQATYTIKIIALDINGSRAFLQMMAIINGQSEPSSAATSEKGGFSSLIPDYKQWAWIVWPTYSVIILMVASYWLGERQELFELTKYAPSRRRRHA